MQPFQYNWKKIKKKIENRHKTSKYAFWQKKRLLRLRDFSFENIQAALGKKKELWEVGYNLLPLTSAVNQSEVGKHSLPGQS